MKNGINLLHYNNMLTIKCSFCGKKIIKYNKIGSGRVLKCYKDRITKFYIESDKDLRCTCGALLGNDSGQYYKMIKSHFTYKGTKN